VRPDTGNDLVDAVLHAAHRIRTAADADLRKGGLSLPGYKLLKALAREDRSMREISDVLHVSPRTVTDIIDGLEARELVVRCAHPSDRRVTLLHLTEAGAVRLAEAAARRSVHWTRTNNASCAICWAGSPPRPRRRPIAPGRAERTVGRPRRAARSCSRCRARSVNSLCTAGQDWRPVPGPALAGSSVRRPERRGDPAWPSTSP
jgi:DNA-binding MarR family transcriptional regulator